MVQLKQPNQRERDLMIRTILGEAGGEDDEGKAAVAWSIINRLNDGGFGGSYEDVVMAPKQYSTWNTDGSGNKLSRGGSPNTAGYQVVNSILDDIFSGAIPDMTGASTHYYSPKGMQDLQSKGYQSHLVPKWFDAEMKKRGGDDLYTHGNHIFAGRARNSGYDGDVTANAEAPLFDPMESATGIPSAQGDTGILGSATLDQSNVDPESYVDPSVSTAPDSLWGKFDEWLTPDRSRALLALGAGMLSSNGGFGEQLGAGLKLVGEQQDNAATMKFKKEQASKDAEYRQQQHQLALMRLAKGGQSGFQSGTYKMQDDTYEQLNFNPSTGRYTNTAGEDVSASVAFKVPGSEAAGTRLMLNGGQMEKKYQELTQQTNELEAMDNFMSELNGSEGGFANRVNHAVANIKTLMGRGLSQEELILKAREGQLTRLIGGNRKDLTGGGAASDKDMELVLRVLGGSTTDWLYNPEVAQELLQDAYREKSASYAANADTYDHQRNSNPSRFLEHKRYKSKAERMKEEKAKAKDSSGYQVPSNVSGIMKSVGIGD